MSGKLIGRVYGEFGGSRPQLNVLIAYAESADDDGTNCRPSVDLVAYKSGYEPRHVKRIVKDLRALGVMRLVREAAGRRPPEYEIRLEDGPRKETFEAWKAAREEGEDGAVGVTSGAKNEAAGVTSTPVGVSPASPLDEDADPVGVTFENVGVTFGDARGDISDRRGDTQDTQPIDPSTTRRDDPGEDAREPGGELRYLSDETRRCVEALASIKNWDKDRAKTIALVSEAMRTYPHVDVLQTGTNLAYKVRVGTCRYKKPSKAFSNWVVMDEERRKRNVASSSRGSSGRRAANSIAVVGASEEDFDGDF